MNWLVSYINQPLSPNKNAPWYRDDIEWAWVSGDILASSADASKPVCMAGVMHKVAGGTGYSQVFWFFSASVTAQLACTVFIFHRYYIILSTDIVIK
jgi:hypothetical protein